jgi:hypothetical protein
VFNCDEHKGQKRQYAVLSGTTLAGSAHAANAKSVASTQAVERERIREWKACHSDHCAAVVAETVTENQKHMILLSVPKSSLCRGALIRMSFPCGLANWQSLKYI